VAGFAEGSRTGFGLYGLWDLGEMTGSFRTSVPSHGVMMVTIKP
jgi:hypothetical protein